MWYAVGTEWLDFVREVLPDREHVHHYHLTLDRARIRVLGTVDELEAFTREYSSGDLADSRIVWPRVVSDFAALGIGGIEVAPYHFNFRGRSSSWYYGWDAASGVIWEDSVLLASTLIPRPLGGVSQSQKQPSP